MSKSQFVLLFSVILIFAMGILMVFNISSADVLERKLSINPHSAALKQLSYAFVALICSFLCYQVGYRVFIRYSAVILIFLSFLLVLVFIPGIGQQINGAHRWLKIFGVSFQPSEFVKYAIPLYFIHVMTSDAKPTDFKQFIKFAAKFVIPAGLILIEPDNGTVGIIFMALVALCILTKIKALYWALPLFLCAVVVGSVAMQMKHVPDRIRIYLHPETDLKGKGHQPHQAKIAAGSGGIFGRGIGESMQKLNYLPEARSDYIAAIYAEECGFVGVVVLVLLYVAIGTAGFVMAINAAEIRAYYLLSIFAFLICFQAFLNLGVVSGLLPSKGTNLPFFSQGGSSLFVNFIALGLMLSAGAAERKAVSYGK